MQEWVLSVLCGADGEHEGRPEHRADGSLQQTVEVDDAKREGYVPEALRAGWYRIIPHLASTRTLDLPPSLPRQKKKQYDIDLQRFLEVR